MTISQTILLCALIVFGLYFLQGKESDAQKLNHILDEAAALPPYEDQFRYSTAQANALADIYQISDEEVMKPVRLW